MASSPLTFGSASEDAVAQLSPVVRQRLESLAETLRPRALAELLDPAMRNLLAHAFTLASADEGTLWLADPDRAGLVPVLNTGPWADRIVDQFRQPFGSGLVSMVYASEQPFLENEVYKNRRQCKRLDRRLKVQTWSLIIVPLRFVGACRGVVSCVQLKRGVRGEPDPAGFAPAHLEVVERAASVTGRLLDHALLRAALGWVGE